MNKPATSQQAAASKSGEQKRDLSRVRVGSVILPTFDEASALLRNHVPARELAIRIDLTQSQTRWG